MTYKPIIGKECTIDEGVIIGYETGRKIAYRGPVIGDYARIRSGTVIYLNVSAGHHLETGHGVVIREETIIGDYLNVWNNTTVDYGCTIGNRVKIHTNVYVAQFTEIEDDVFIGPGVVITNDPHPVCTKCMKGPTIRRGARIGGNATLLPRIVIGENVLIGAGSVVTTDIPPRMVAYGNPAIVRGSVDDLECQFGIVDRPYLDGLDVSARRRNDE